MVLRAAPYRETFEQALAAAPAGGDAAGGAGAAAVAAESVAADMALFCSAFRPLLAKVEAFLDEEGLNDPTPV